MIHKCLHCNTKDFLRKDLFGKQEKERKKINWKKKEEGMTVCSKVMNVTRTHQTHMWEEKRKI